MKGKRLWHCIVLCLIPNAGKRTRYLKKKNVFASIGDNVSIMSRKVPLYANLIKIGNNVHIASDVDFITHDITHMMLNHRLLGKKEFFPERIGCIEISDNVFIGAGSYIMYDVKIGENVIIAAGSVITRDIPQNSVVGGVPVKVLCTMDSYLQKRKMVNWYPHQIRPQKQEVCDELAQWMWRDFYSRRPGFNTGVNNVWKGENI